MKYSERILPSFGVSLALSGLLLATSFAIWAALDTDVAATFALVASILALLWWRSAIHRVDFDGHVLRVNDAKIEIQYISSCRSLETGLWSQRKGREFDPALFHAHRFWHRSGIEITIDDARDPHPGWLVGCKDPERLSAMINDSLSSEREVGFRGRD